MFRHTFPFLILLGTITFIPTYAEVASLQTDRSLYSVDMSIYFTGTVDSTDSQKLVNLMINDPNGGIVLMTGKIADSNNTFQITVNTNDPSQFSLKGTYSATAFVNSKQGGKTVFFDFSPDGSPVYHPPQSNNATAYQNQVNSTSEKRISTNEKFTPNESVKIADSMTALKKISATSNPSMPSYQLADVFYPLMAICGAGLIGFIVYYRKKKMRGLSEQSSEQPNLKNDGDQDYALMILKNRLAKGEITLEEFKITKDALSES